jgi:hypothetical protein
VSRVGLAPQNNQKQSDQAAAFPELAFLFVATTVTPRHFDFMPGTGKLRLQSR